MRIFLQKLLPIKKHLIYIALLLAFLVVPTSFVFAGGSGDPGILADMMTILMTPFSFLARMAGSLMGVTMYYTVVRMGYYVHQLTAIQTAWELFRDLGNIFIVFGFIAIGIATILDNATYGAKKALPKLLIVAILLNFSLFFAEFVVDTGNVFATQFYASINGGHLPASASSFKVSKEPVSGSVITVLKTTGLYKPTNPPLTSVKMIELGILSIIMFIIIAFVFFAIAIMLVSRFVILLFLFIVSPIGFIGLAGIPLISDYGRKWWKALTDQTLLAPILFLFLLVVTKIIQSNFMQALSGGKTTLSQAINSTSVTPLANMLLLFAVVIGLLFVSLITAKSLSGKAASFAIGASRKGMARMFSMNVGGAARVLRGASRLTGDNKFSRGVGHLTRPIERANFDVIGKLGGKQALGMGKLENTSFRHISTHLPLVGENGVIEQIKEKNLAEMDVEERNRQKKEAGKDSKRAIKEKQEGEKEKETANAEMLALKENQKKNTEPVAGYEEKRKSIQDRIDGADKKIEGANKTISDGLSKLSIAEISKLDEIKKGVGTLSQSLSPERFAALMKSDALTEQQKSKLKDQRYAPITQATEHKDGTKIKGMSVKDLEQYAGHNPAGFKAMGAMFSESQVNQLMKSGSLNTQQRGDMKDSRNARFNIEIHEDGTKGISSNAKKELQNMSTEDIAKLSTETLSKPEVLRAISPRKLMSMLSNKDQISSDDKYNTVLEHVRNEMKEGTKAGQHFINATISNPELADRLGL